MIAWLRRLLAGRELDELDRWRVYCNEAERWFAEFPEVALALEHLRRHAEGDAAAEFITRVRGRMRRVRYGSQADHS